MIVNVSEVIAWLNSPHAAAIAALCGMLGGLAVVFAIARFIWRWLKKRTGLVEVPVVASSRVRPAPRTWWEYLTNDLSLPPKARKVCADLYDFGWEQLNRPCNNRDENIEEAGAQLRELTESLNKEDTALAERSGIGLAESTGMLSDDDRVCLDNLPPTAQSYARLRARIRGLEQEIAQDLALGIPLTDFRKVKRALKDGTPPTEILDQLPLAWRMIRTIRDPVPRRRASAHAAKPIRVRLSVVTDTGIKKDDKAELDEGWVTSDKLDLATPFRGIISIYKHVANGRPPIIKDRRMVVDSPEPPGTESRFWTSGGYADRVLERAARGEDPATLRRELRSKRINFAIAGSGVLLLVFAIVFRLLT